MSHGNGKTPPELATFMSITKRRITASTLRLRLGAALVAIDIAALFVAFAVAQFYKNMPQNWYGIFAIAVPFYFSTALNSGAYGIAALQDERVGRSAALRSLAFGFTALFLISYFFQVEQRLPRLTLLGTMALSVILIVFGRKALGRTIKRQWKHSLVHLLVIRDGVHVALPPEIECVDASTVNLSPDLRDPVMFNRFAELTRDADRVVVSTTPSLRDKWAMMLKGGDALGEVVVDDIGSLRAIGLNRLDLHHTLIVASAPLSFEQRFAKRSLDLLLCIPILIVLAPVLLLITLAVKLDSPGPVLFRQRRIGRNNAFFSILKFRSMHVDLTDPDGNVSTQRDDKRITRVGHFIRKTSIDELPQLFNVLGGSMSIVGPRPHALGSLAGERLFWDVDERYWHRHALKPGITGLAQVRGFRGATLHTYDLTNRLQADLEYMSDWSISKELSILFSTFKVLIHKNSF